MAVENNLANRQQKTGLTAYLTQDAVKNQINSVISGKDGTRFISSMVSAVQANTDLQECSNSSIVSAALLGESLKLSPSPQLGQYYMVPFNNKKKGIKQAQFQIGYKGLMQLAQRSGQYLDLGALEIHEGEYKGRDKYTGKQKFEFIEDDDERDSLPITGYMAYFELLSGFRKTIYWSKAKVERHADTYSKAFNLNDYRRLQANEIPEKDKWKYSSFWYKDFDDMAKKTMIRQLLQKNGAPLSIEMMTAMDSDLTIIHKDGTKEYVEMEDNVVIDQKDNEVPSEGPVSEEPAQQEPLSEDTVQQSFFDK